MSYPHAVFGAGGLGAAPGSFTHSWDTPEAVSEVLEYIAGFQIYELDSGASYPPGNPWRTETLLGGAKSFDERFIFDTKIHPFEARALASENIEKSVARSLELTGRSKARILYAHLPDKTTPLEETAAAFHKIHQQGLCDFIGLCNFSVQDLQTYLDICEEKGYTKPSYYQEQYNALDRGHEKEMFPLLRKHNMHFYAYSPLAGGFLSGKVTFSKNKDESTHAPLPEKTRWQGSTQMKLYPDVFDNEQAHAAIRKLHDVCQTEGVTLANVSLRWLMYHSRLQEGDGIIIGASKLEQIKSNASAFQQGPLSKVLLDAVEQLHTDTKDRSFSLMQRMSQ